MGEVICQLIAILSLIVIAIFMFLDKEECNERAGENLWVIKCQRQTSISPGIFRLLRPKIWKQEIEVPEGSFYLGNRMICNDIVLEVDGRFRLYMEVLPDVILLTVLEGEIKMNGHCFRRDDSGQKKIKDHMELFINGTKLIFKKKRG